MPPLPPRLPAGASPSTFAAAVKRSIADVARKAAGSDDVIDARDAKQALATLELTGTDVVAKAAFEKIVRTNKSVGVAEFVEAQGERAQKAATKAAGDDGKLSKADADLMPKDLRVAFHVLRGQRAEVGGLFRTGLARFVPQSWRAALADVAPQIDKVSAFVDDERRRGAVVYPPAELTFNALAKTPLDKVKVVIIGQDPYHGPDEAHGLSFSVPAGVAVPPSLDNVFKELHQDLGVAVSPTGDLTKWAERGVLLLNTALTVRKDEPGSHGKKGWEEVTDAILEKVNQKDERVVFLLLGADAQKLGRRIDTSKHTIVARSHPSPLSVRRNFEGTKPFSEINAALVAGGQQPIDWRL